MEEAGARPYGRATSGGRPRLESGPTGGTLDRSPTPRGLPRATEVIRERRCAPPAGDQSRTGAPDRGLLAAAPSKRALGPRGNRPRGLQGRPRACPLPFVTRSRLSVSSAVDARGKNGGTAGRNRGMGEKGGLRAHLEHARCSASGEEAGDLGKDVGNDVTWVRDVGVYE
ncbi:hypothetical protein KM043_000457 [Ampulex compressa]|nr:hypothetical protein KM043_000457 [Ampulex compressa]